jgi:hypothetical protein
MRPRCRDTAIPRDTALVEAALTDYTPHHLEKIMSFNAKLTELLKTDKRFVDDEGELLTAAVQDRAWKIDHDLVKLLLSDKEIKAKFFDEIAAHWVFNLNTFIEYISQKNFLDNGRDFPREVYGHRCSENERSDGRKDGACR